MTLGKHKRKIVILIISAEMTVLAFFIIKGEFIDATLVVTALVKEMLHGIPV